MFPRLITVLLLCCPMLAVADKDYFYECKHRDKLRIIEVTYEELQTQVPCSVRYHKSTGSDQLWTATNMAGYCEEQAAEFAEKQKQWGWECELVSDYYDPAVHGKELFADEDSGSAVVASGEESIVDSEINQTECYTEYCRQVEILLARSDSRIKELEAELDSLKEETVSGSDGSDDGTTLPADDESMLSEDATTPSSDLGAL